MRYANTWQSAKSTSFEFAYSPSSAYTVVDCDYVYVKTKTFAINGQSFDWANTPYHIGSDKLTGWTKYVPTDKPTFWYGGGSPDNKLTLDSEDDVARVNWGGNWRMPKSEEISALLANTTKEWKDNYNVTGKCGHLFTSTVAGEAGHSIFITATGYAADNSLKNDDTVGNYWSCNISSELDPDSAFGLFSSISKGTSLDRSQRYHGFPVRPVSD